MTGFPSYKSAFRLLKTSVFALLCFFNISQGVAAAQSPSPVSQDEKEEAKSVRPGIHAPFLSPDLSVEEFLEKFEVESREVYTERETIAETLDLEPGMHIADVGAGTGAYFEVLTSGIGEKGKLYAVDISPVFVEYLRERAESLKLGQIEVVQCDDRNSKLEPESVDRVFTCDTYHHFEFPLETLTSIYKALKPGGMFVVVDFEKIEGKSREWTMDHVRADKETVRSEIEAIGFQFLDEPKIEGLSENYVMRFTKSK